MVGVTAAVGIDSKKLPIKIHVSGHYGSLGLKFHP